MDNVIVEARCDIKDCLIGSGQTIHESCKCTYSTAADCNSRSTSLFPFTAKSSNEILVDAGTLLEI